MDQLDLEEATAAHLPDEFLTATIKSVFLARYLSRSACRKEFEQTEAANVEPFYVRAKVESLIRNGPMLLTSHAVETPCGMVHDAKYRKSLAESQSSLIAPEKVIPGAKLYALLLHGPFRGRTHQETADYAYLPGSVYLAFPEAALKRYAHKINLFEKFSGVVDELLPKEWDTEARLVYRWRARQVGAA